MAALMGLVLKQVVSPEQLADWLDGKSVDKNVNTILDEYSGLKYDFIPEFLNRLREGTLPIVENGVGQSPNKPQSKIPPKLELTSNTHSSKARRGHLFSTAENQDIHCSSTSATTSGSWCPGSVQSRSVSESTDPHPGSVNAHRRDILNASLPTYNNSVDSFIQEVEENKPSNSYKKTNTRHNTSHTSDLSGDESVVSGRSDNSYYACAWSKSGELSCSVSTSSSSQVQSSRDDSSTILNHSICRARSSSRNSKCFQPPKAHSTPDRWRGGGRLGSNLTLLDFTDRGSDRSRQDSSTDTSSENTSQNMSKCMKGVRKKRGGPNQRSKMSERTGKCTDYNIFSVDDFPPISLNTSDGKHTAPEILPVASGCGDRKPSVNTKNAPAKQTVRGLTTMASPNIAFIMADSDNVSDMKPVCEAGKPHTVWRRLSGKRFALEDQATSENRQNLLIGLNTASVGENSNSQVCEVKDASVACKSSSLKPTNHCSANKSKIKTPSSVSMLQKAVLNHHADTGRGNEVLDHHADTGRGNEVLDHHADTGRGNEVLDHHADTGRGNEVLDHHADTGRGNEVLDHHADKGRGNEVLDHHADTGKGNEVLDHHADKGRGNEVLDHHADTGRGNEVLDHHADTGRGNEVLDHHADTGRGNEVLDHHADTGRGNEVLDHHADTGRGNEVLDHHVDTGRWNEVLDHHADTGRGNEVLDHHADTGRGKEVSNLHRFDLVSPECLKIVTVSPEAEVNLIQNASIVNQSEDDCKNRYTDSGMDTTALEQSLCTSSEQRVMAGSLSAAQQRYAGSVKRIQLADHGDQITSPVRGIWLSQSGDCTGSHTPDVMLVDHSASVINIKLVKASIADVTHKPVLDLFIQLYSACLDAHLFPNLSMELYFLAQLLIAQSSEEELPEQQHCVVDDVWDVSLFQTIHNVVYFAVGVMEKQAELLKHMDRSILRLLSENERVQEFSPKLHLAMKAAFNSMVDHSNHSNQSICLATVSFQAETDNRQNFPSDRSFHQFKKLRDEFFQAMKAWEQHREFPDWTLDISHADRIRRLFQSADLAAHLHFARLFVSQLLTSYKNEQKTSSRADYKDMSQLMSLKTANPDKFLKLQERLMKPASCGGPCPTVRFPGHQQYFCDFLQAANNSQLNHHVSAILVARIDELNKMDFDCHNSSNDDNNFENDSPMSQEQNEECEAFSSRVLTLRLLARFLGFISYLPYHGADTLPQHLLQDSVAIRNTLPPPLDLAGYLNLAVQQGHLPLTAPWMVEYLAMMDVGAPSTKYMKQLLANLHLLLRMVWADLRSSGFTYSHLLLVTSLGWLFDQACLPAGQYQALQHTEHSHSLQITHLAKQKCNNLVTPDLFFTCCPYFGEMRYLLSEFSLGARTKTEVRKVNPRPPRLNIASSVSVTSKDPNTKFIQNKLLGNFFHMYSKSIHRLVEFVADQVSSNFIRNLRYHGLPLALAACKHEMCAVSEVPERARHMCMKTKLEMVEWMESYCSKAVEGSLRLLLPHYTHQPVVTFASKMAYFLTTRKVKRWIHSHVEYDAFHSELKAELLHKSRQSAPCRDHAHKDSRQSAPCRDNAHKDSRQSAPCRDNAHKDSRQSASCRDNAHQNSRVKELIGEASAETDMHLPGVDCEASNDMVSCTGRVRHSLAVNAASSKTRVATVNSIPHSASSCHTNCLLQTLGENVMTSSSEQCLMSLSNGSSLSSFANDKSVNSLVSVPQDGPSNSSPCTMTDNHLLSCTDEKFDRILVVSSLTHFPNQSSEPAVVLESNYCPELSPPCHQIELLPPAGHIAVTSSTGKITSSSTDDKLLVVSPSKNNTSVIAESNSLSSASTVCSNAGSLQADSSEPSDSIRQSQRGTGCKTRPSSDAAAAAFSHGSYADAANGALENTETMMCSLLREVQDLLWTLRVERDGLTQEQLFSFLQHIAHYLSSSEDHPPQTVPYLVQSIAQLAAAVIFCQPCLWTRQITTLFLQLWSNCNVDCEELPALCTTIFMGYFLEAPNVQLSLTLYKELLTELVENKLMTLRQIETAFNEALPLFESCSGMVQSLMKDLTEQFTGGKTKVSS